MDASIDLSDTGALRDVFARFGTGVCVVTGHDESGDTVGFTCQTFAGLSLEPPMILVSVMRTSRTLPHLKAAGCFAVSVLGEGDEDISAMAGSRKADKFDRIRSQATNRGLQVIDGALAWFDCELDNVVDAGDHEILLGRVRDAGSAAERRRPLLFFEGGYAGLHDTRDTEPDLSGLLTATGPGTWL